MAGHNTPAVRQYASPITSDILKALDSDLAPYREII
jgi:hypothetical protein